MEGVGWEMRLGLKRVDLGRVDEVERGWWRRRRKREKRRRERGEEAMSGGGSMVVKECSRD